MNRSPITELDLDAASRSALGFDELLEWVASFTRTAVGAARILASAPSAEASVIDARLGAAGEMGRFVLAGGTLIGQRTSDPLPALQTVAIEGAQLDGKALRELARVVDAAMQVRARLSRLETGQYPILQQLGCGIPGLRSIADPVLSGTDPEGGLLDDASAELRRLRERRARVGERLRRTLQRYLHEPGAASVIRDDFVTQRNGRFVVPVRTDSPRAVRGIVHASSSSGATRFVEPLESVEANNDLVRLHDEELAEERRILGAWSQSFRSRLDELWQAIEALASADAWQAGALFASAAEAVVPRVGTGRSLRLQSLRHPLLDRRLKATGCRAVPSSIVLDPPERVLVVSGPNAGGKTVAIKALGLAVLMAQSGFPVAADDAELPLYRQVRADIGDHQSIQADLSTYSAHVRAIADSLRDRRPPVLFLFDEIGTGTEPGEGAALAQAILESLVAVGITAVATTHLGPVKAWAVTADGVETAALDLDPGSLTPTYRVVMGVAGRSAGLEIASRHGIQRGIVERARNLLEPGQREGEDYLERLRCKLAEIEGDAVELRRQRCELEEERRLWQDKQARDAELRGREAERKLKTVLEEFRRQARRELAAIEVPAERARADRRLQRSERRLAAEGTQRSAELGARPAETPAPGEPLDPSRMVAGTTVWVRSVARLGTLVGVEGREAEVRLGSVVFRVRVDELHEPPPGESATPEPGARQEARAEVRVVSRNAGARSRELMLVGQRVEQALEELERFLDSANVADYDEVRIVHGHGSGRLRAAVRRYLDDHPFVKSQRPGVAGEGGDGATVVSLV